MDKRHVINQTIRKLTFFFSFSLLLASIPAAMHMGESFRDVLASYMRILTSPCPLVTDYFHLGSLAAALLNAGICGTICSVMLLRRDSEFSPGVWAGYFLVVAHCFYGLNFVNMWPPLIGFAIYCKMHKLRFRDNLDWAMFITSFAPFFSELMFRYPFLNECGLTVFGIHIDMVTVTSCVILALFVGNVLPAILPGTAKLHHGFNLYNGGLATGLMGLFIYAFMYQTMGVTPPEKVVLETSVARHPNGYLMFGTVFYLYAFGACILWGWFKNDRSFAGYKALLKDSGLKTNFLYKYGPGLTLINLGIYGLMMVAYFDIVIFFTDGAGFTGATFGIILAAMTFAASGQHPKNVWPTIAGYGLLSACVHIACFTAGRPIPWTLSTQGYMNGLAFATGLCPFSGKYGWRVGVLAGFISAVMCTTTSVMHGGFVLYNGGLTAGLAALILLPMLDTYVTKKEKWGRGRRSEPEAE